MMTRVVAAVGSAMALCACGGGVDGQTASSSSSSVASASLTGTVNVVSLMDSGTVTAYNFIGGKRGQVIAATTLNSLGQYKLDVTPGLPTILEVASGCYAEVATQKGQRPVIGASVCMSQSESLHAVIVPSVGTNMVSITPYTEAAWGLASYLAQHGRSDADAVDAANQHLSTVLGYDIQGVTPALTDSTSVFDNSHAYGLLLSGISSWVDSVAVSASSPFGTTPYTTLHFANSMAADLQADGLLDGKGVDGNGNAIILSLGSTTLSGNLYRHSISAMAALHLRYQGQYSDIPNFLPSLVQYNNSNDVVFSGAVFVPLDEGGPIISNNSLLNFPNGSGDYAINLSVDDVVGIPARKIEFFVDGNFYDVAAFSRYLGPVNFSVNTTIFPNGNHMIKVRVTNFLGNLTEQSATVNFQN